MRLLQHRDLTVTVAGTLASAAQADVSAKNIGAKRRHTRLSGQSSFALLSQQDTRAYDAFIRATTNAAVRVSLLSVCISASTDAPALRLSAQELGSLIAAMHESGTSRVKRTPPLSRRYSTDI